jgi:hypothetical protein
VLVGPRVQVKADDWKATRLEGSQFVEVVVE